MLFLRLVRDFGIATNPFTLEALVLGVQVLLEEEGNAIFTMVTKLLVKMRQVLANVVV